MGAAIEVIETHGGRARAGGDDRRPLGAAAGAPGSAAGEVPLAIDELPLVALAGLLRRGRDGRRGRRGAAPQGVGPDRDRGRRACARSGPRSRRPPTASRSRGTGGLRGGALDAAGDHRLAMLGAVAGLASREGVEVRGMEAAGGQLPGLRARPDAADALSVSAVATDGPRRATARAPAAGARPRSPRPRGARSGRRRRAGRGRRRPGSPPGSEISTAPDDHHEPGALVDLVLGEALARPAGRARSPVPRRRR